MKILIALLLGTTAFGQANHYQVLLGLVDAPNTPIDSNSGGGCTGSSPTWSCTSAPTITLTDATATTIIYTTNGTTPNCTGTGTLYTTPFAGPSSTFTLKAIGCNGITGGGVLSSVYTISGGTNVSLDATSISATQTPTTSYSWTHTISGGCTNPVVVVWGANFDTVTDVTGITYGGVSMTHSLSTNSQTGAAESLYYLINPATGAQTVIVSQTSQYAWGGAASFCNANQSSQPDATGTPSANSSCTTCSVTVNVASTGSYVCQMIYVGHNVTFSGPTWISEQNSTDAANGQAVAISCTGPIGSTGNQTGSWTQSGSSSNEQGNIAVSIKH